MSIENIRLRPNVSASSISGSTQGGPPSAWMFSGVKYRQLLESISAVWLAMTDFGQDGPYRDWAGADLVHLALGGQMAVCGYPAGEEPKGKAAPKTAPEP